MSNQQLNSFQIINTFYVIFFIYTSHNIQIQQIIYISTSYIMRKQDPDLPNAKKVDKERIQISEECLHDRLKLQIKKLNQNKLTNSSSFNQYIYSQYLLGNVDEVEKCCQAYVNQYRSKVYNINEIYTWIYSYQQVLSVLSGKKRRVFLDFVSKRLVDGNTQFGAQIYTNTSYIKALNSLIAHLSYISMDQQVIKLCDVMLGCDPGVYNPNQYQYQNNPQALATYLTQYSNSLKIRLKYVKIKARALQNMGKIDRALQLYDSVIKQFPDFVEVLCEKFKFIYNDLEKQDDAFELFKDQGDYDYFQFHQQAGITFCEVSQYNKSLAHFKRCIQRCEKATPLKCLQTYYMRAIAYFNLNREEEALESISVYFKILSAASALSYFQLTTAVASSQINLNDTLPTLRNIALSYKKSKDFIENMETLLSNWKLNAVGALHYVTTQKGYIFYVTGDKNKAFDLYSPSNTYYELLYNFTYNSYIESKKIQEEDIKKRRQRGEQVWLGNQQPRNYQQQAQTAVNNAKDYNPTSFKQYLLNNCEQLDPEQKIKLYESYFVKYPGSKANDQKYAAIQNDLLVQQKQYQQVIDNYHQKLNSYFSKDQLVILLKIPFIYKSINEKKQYQKKLNLAVRLLLSVPIELICYGNNGENRSVGSEYFKTALHFANLILNLCDSLQNNQVSGYRIKLFQVFKDLWDFLEHKCFNDSFTGLNLMTEGFKKKIEILKQFEQHLFSLSQEISKLSQGKNKKEVQQIQRIYKKWRKILPGELQVDQIREKREMQENEPQKVQAAIQKRENEPNQQVRVAAQLLQNQDQLLAKILALEIKLKQSEKQNKYLKEKLKVIFEAFGDYKP